MIVRYETPDDVNICPSCRTQVKVLYRCQCCQTVMCKVCWEPEEVEE